MLKMKGYINRLFYSQDESSTKDKEEEKKEESTSLEETGGGQASRTLEERRRSMLDHHWAVPSKDRCSFSVDDEHQDSLNSEKVIPRYIYFFFFIKFLLAFEL